MAYTTNPNVPKVRGEAVESIRKGWSTRKVALHFGYTQGAIVKWVARAKDGRGLIPTKSSRPHNKPAGPSS